MSVCDHFDATLNEPRDHRIGPTALIRDWKQHLDCGLQLFRLYRPATLTARVEQKQNLVGRFIGQKCCFALRCLGRDTHTHRYTWPASALPNSITDIVGYFPFHHNSIICSAPPLHAITAPTDRDGRSARLELATQLSQRCQIQQARQFSRAYAYAVVVIIIISLKIISLNTISIRNQCFRFRLELIQTQLLWLFLCYSFSICIARTQQHLRIQILLDS